jgi:hypothetical protein
MPPVCGCPNVPGSQRCSNSSSYLSAQAEENHKKDAHGRRNLQRTTDVLTTPMRSAYESPTYHAGALHGLYAV